MKVVVIPAKQQSSRLNNKNMKLVNGFPMLHWTLQYSLLNFDAEKVFVSSDSQEIGDFAASYGVGFVPRPPYLIGDTPILDVYRHAVVFLEASGKVKNVETLIGLQPDHPDRRIPLDDVLKSFYCAGAHRLMSVDKNGEKNGAHYVLSRYFLDYGHSENDLTIVDDCTNIHFQSDLDRAEAFLKKASIK